jgi:S-adenosylmethionine-diacylgycerolhomoserine-N-methlytransferase
MSSPSQTPLVPVNALQRYYQWQHLFYDSTRWTFLLGREGIVQKLAAVSSPKRILEVGCGTGANLSLLRQHFPSAQIVGVDLSPHMLEVAERRAIPGVELKEQAYHEALSGDFDAVLFSYSLSMMNPGWNQALHAAWQDLRNGGILAVVDFHTSPLPLMRQWMQLHHVRMDAHLRPTLRHLLTAVSDQVKPAYGGLWSTLQFIGMKTQAKQGFTGVAPSPITPTIPSTL